MDIPDAPWIHNAEVYGDPWRTPYDGPEEDEKENE